jgi:hypothetical protein
MAGVSVVVAVAGGWLASDALSFVTGGVVASSVELAGAVASVAAGVSGNTKEFRTKCPMPWRHQALQGLR